MNVFEQGLLAYLNAEHLRKLQAVHIGIAGTGGLGSNCALLLVRCGFRRFTLVDFDVVEPSNLNRQFFFSRQVGRLKVEMLRENLLAINPELVLRIFQEKVTVANVERLFADCQVVVEAFDKARDKKMMVEAFLSSDKLVVSASGIAGWGGSDHLVVRHVRPNLFVVGDLTTESGPDYPPMAPRVHLAAAKQADIILAHVLGNNYIHPMGGSREQCAE